MGWLDRDGVLRAYPIYKVPEGYRIRDFSVMFAAEIAEVEGGGLGFIAEVLAGVVQAVDFNTDGFKMTDRDVGLFYESLAMRLTRHGSVVSMNYFAGVGMVMCFTPFVPELAYS